MADIEGDLAVSTAPLPVVGMVSNIGEPLRFTNIEDLGGFSVEPAQAGQEIKIWIRGSLTSDEPLFHRIIENLSSVINHMALQAGTSVHLSGADTVLLVMRADKTAELWLDTAAISIRCAVKRAIAAGTALFERDIADITGMGFPCVNIGPKDKVLCIFREGWRFAMAFDFNANGNLDTEAFTSALGALVRKLRYRHIYDSFADQVLFERLVSTGWFPFAEIIMGEFKDLLRHCEAGFEIAEIEERIIAKFDEGRMQGIFDRWMAKPHFATKAGLLKVAIEAFNRREPVAVIKILLTEIEGILSAAYRAAHGGHSAKIKGLLQFAKESAERKAGGPDTLMFPAAFAEYLARHTFADFDPVAETGTASSRHAVGHGAAGQDSYTMLRALQAILTLDQLAFYT